MLKITPTQYLAKLAPEPRAMIEKIRRILKTRSALKVVDGAVEVISEGEWEKFN